MQYARIVIYSVHRDSADESIRRARGGLSPLFQSLPGFVSHTIVKADDGKGVSMSVWETKEDAEEADRRAAEWIHANVEGMLDIGDVYIGTVQHHAAEETTGTAAARRSPEPPHARH